MCVWGALPREVTVQMLAVADWALIQAEVFVSPQILPLPTAIQGIKMAYLTIPVSAASMTCIKVSIALALLRIPVNRPWRVFLFSVTALQVAHFAGSTVYIFLYCRPLHAV